MLRAGGHVAYLAGGCVRDELLGLAPKDYDVATDATPGRVVELFRSLAGFRSVEVGVSFGVVLVRRRGVATEVATFREDGPYEDKRRPGSVTFSTPEADAKRRDFTVNALFLEVEGTGDRRSAIGGASWIASEAPAGVIDFVGGVADLRAGVIRAVGEPAARLAEDHLRALRAVRFACRLGFEIEAGTAHAIRAHASELAGVSRERIGDEVRRMMTMVGGGSGSTAGGRGRAARLLSTLGLDRPIFGASVEATEGGLLDAPVEMAYPVALAAWAIDRGLDPRDAGRRGEMASAWRRALCLTNQERDGLAGTLRDLAGLLTDWFEKGVAAQKRGAASPTFGGAMTLFALLSPEGAGGAQERLDELAGIGGGLWPEPLIDGDRLIAMGMRPGPVFGALLARVYDAQLEGRIGTAAEAESMARELSGSGGVE